MFRGHQLIVFSLKFWDPFILTRALRNGFSYRLRKYWIGLAQVLDYSCCCCCLAAKSCPTLWQTHCKAHQAPLSMGFSRQEYWNGLPFPSLGDLPNPGIEPVSPALAGRFFTTEPPEKLLGYRHHPNSPFCNFWPLILWLMTSTILTLFSSITNAICGHWVGWRALPAASPHNPIPC